LYNFYTTDIKYLYLISLIKSLKTEVKIPDEINFEIGGRYRNRKGWYEVLDIEGDSIKVRYEMDAEETTLNIEIQKRIILNISQEEAKIKVQEKVKK